MDIDLRDTGATIIIGLYSILVFALLTQMIWGGVLIRWAKFSRRLGPFALPIVVGLVGFAIGMVVEDLSNNFVDDAEDSSSYVLDSETELRTRSLFGSIEAIQPHPLARDCAQLGLISLHGGPSGRRVEECILKDDLGHCLRTHEITPKAIGETADRLYYHAKNTVYQYPNYFTELRAIQTRIDFARSVTIVSLWSFVAVIVAFIGRSAVAFARGGKQTIDVILRATGTRRIRTIGGAMKLLGQNSKNAMIWHMPAARTAQFLAFFLATSLIASQAYSFEEVEFNKRTFGYFRTLAEKQPRMRIAKNGFSGMAYHGTTCKDGKCCDRYLVVHDTKDGSDHPYVGLLLKRPEQPPYEIPLSFEWTDLTDTPPSDIEAVCAVPEPENRYLLIESGFSGRVRAFLIHVATEPPWKTTTEAVIDLPLDVPANGEDRRRVEIEGAVCIRVGNKMVLTLAERDPLPKEDPLAPAMEARIHVGDLNLTAKSFSPKSAKINLDTTRFNGEGLRLCGDLCFDGSKLWSVATIDPGDDGPFTSLIYQAAELDMANELLWKPRVERGEEWVVAGFKVEGLTAIPVTDEPEPPARAKHRFAIATDDERLEGVWRAID